MDIQKKLSWLRRAGVTFLCAETPKSLFVSESPNSTREKQSPATVQAETFASQAITLADLNKEKLDFNISSLKKTATHTILGTGSISPKLMCILDMPDADSDRSGKPLTGAQAEQLKKMMTAIHLDIEKDVYLTYSSPWRTPGNRPLTEAERALFLPFLKKEIQFVQPQVILLFGATLCQSLLKINTLAKARGAWHTWENIPVRATLALATLKTTPLRQQAWLDLQEVEKKLSSF